MSEHVAGPGWTVVLAAIRKAADVYYGLFCACHFGIRRSDWTNAARSLRSMFDPPSPGSRRPRAYYRLAKKVQRARAASPTRRALGIFFKALADPGKVIWIPPADITRKVVYRETLFCNDVLAGDWDLQTQALDGAPKYRAVTQHFRDGRSWRTTDLFARRYTQRIESGQAVRGSENLAALEAHYEGRYDGLYASIKEHGLQLSLNDDGYIDVPHVHIGRDGCLLFDRNGNHRLVVAKLLGVARLPCRVQARHLAWQQVRERVAALGPERCWEIVDRRLATHPDLADVLERDDEPVAARLDAAAARIPSSYGTRRGLLLRRLAREAPAGTCVVQVGGWLGAGTAQLARGIGERPGADGLKLYSYDAWRATREDVHRAARRGAALAVGEDLLPRVRRVLAPLGVTVELGRVAGTAGGWEGGAISLYVDETSGVHGLSARCVEWCVRSWIPGETVLVLEGEIPGARTLPQHLVTVNPGCFTLLEETAKCQVWRYAAAMDLEKLTSEARTWSLAAAVRAHDREIREILDSTSWRVTAPLRRIGKLGRRFPHHPTSPST